VFLKVNIQPAFWRQNAGWTMFNAMRILVIEDYLPLQTALVRGLREAGYSVDAASDGREGACYAETGEYDAIVLDIMLPKRDGWTILEQLRDQGKQTHVLVLTAKDQLVDRIRGLNLGADDYLVKPFAFEELLARVAALVRRKYNCKSPVIRVADLEIDRNTRTVHRAGERIDLSARELSLLEFLAMRPGRVVSRDEIWEHVYDFSSIPGSNVIDVYVRLLRRKIERHDWPRLIHTRRGQGYVLGEA
jgi:DNA-binding response OmpR family regulator